MFIIFIGTYQTQSVTVENITHHTQLCISCTFITGSIASGCYGIFVNNKEQAPNQTINIPKKKTESNGRNCIDELLSGVYDLLVYDRNEYGNIEYSGVAVIVHDILYSNTKETVTTTNYATHASMCYIYI